MFVFMWRDVAVLQFFNSSFSSSFNAFPLLALWFRERMTTETKNYGLIVLQSVIWTFAQMWSSWSVLLWIWENFQGRGPYFCVRWKLKARDFCFHFKKNSRTLKHGSRIGFRRHLSRSHYVLSSSFFEPALQLTDVFYISLRKLSQKIESKCFRRESRFDSIYRHAMEKKSVDNSALDWLSRKHWSRKQWWGCSSRMRHQMSVTKCLE